MVSVGVTGHRVLAEIEKLEAGIDAALAEIEWRFGGAPIAIVELPDTSGDGDGRVEAYLAGGRYLLDHCDVILAVWDGQGAQGRGGTATIVGLAREAGLPVARVQAGNRRPGTMVPTTIGPDQDRVTYESFPEPT